MAECPLNYSGLTFTVSLWRAEQAFVMSHKPLNEKRLAIYGYNLQPIQATAARQLFPRLEENEDHKRFAQDLLPICSLLHAGENWQGLWRADHCGVRVGGISRHYFLQDQSRSGVESAAAAPVFRLRSSNSTIFISTAGRVGGDGLSWATERDNVERHCRFFSTVRSKWLISD